MFKITCRKCLAVLRLSNDRLGETVQCPVCSCTMLIARPSRAADAPAPPPAMIRHACVRCGNVLEVAADHVGKMEECPTCGTRLIIPAASPSTDGDGASSSRPSPRADRERANVRQLVARDCGQMAIVAATPFADEEMVRLCRQGRDLVLRVQQCNKRARKLREVLAETDPRTEHARFVEVREHLAIIERKAAKVQRALNSLATTLGQMIIEQSPPMPEFGRILHRLDEPAAPAARRPPQEPARDLNVSGTLWYCRINDRAFGPVDASGLMTWLRQGYMKLDDAVRSEEMPQWQALKDVRALAADDQRRQKWPREFVEELAMLQLPPAQADAPRSLWRDGTAALRKAASRVGLFRKEGDLGAHAPHASSGPN
ncbi:MAG: DUF4339 domain-containing protein [Planctomycetaceae bacterium]|nr:DUF4339 domain-containing protein [Planctomycetaceae bacterium]